MSDSPAPPPAPDYAGAAQATAAGNLQAAQSTTAANRLNQYGPNGSITYTQPSDYASNPGTLNPWSVTETLSPAQQALYDQNQRTNQTLGNVAQQGVGYVQSALNHPLSMAGMNDPTVTDAGNPAQFNQQASDASYANATRYLDPQLAQQRESQDAQLANQGLTPGSQAYNNAHQQFDANAGQQYAAARNAAYLTGAQVGSQNYNNTLQGNNQHYNQQLTLQQNQLANAQTMQNNPINMLNAVRSGQQMQAAQMPNQIASPQQQQTSGPDMLGAATAKGTYNQGIYNAQQQANASQSSGAMGMLGQLGGAAIMMSDRRVKRFIERIGTHKLGIGLYKWVYIWGVPSVGVMADEVETVMPNAVSVGTDGYKRVNYDMLEAA